jgi:hypothetical protein
MAGLAASIPTISAKAPNHRPILGETGDCVTVTSWFGHYSGLLMASDPKVVVPDLQTASRGDRTVPD